ncbi:unnamed protein product, partial [Brenthis ino]
MRCNRMFTSSKSAAARVAAAGAGRAGGAGSAGGAVAIMPCWLESRVSSRAAPRHAAGRYQYLGDTGPVGRVVALGLVCGEPIPRRYIHSEAPAALRPTRSHRRQRRAIPCLKS